MARKSLGDVVAHRIEDERKRRGWSFRQLADALDVPVSTAHGWATGDVSPNLDSLEKIAKTFEWEVTELLAS